MHLIIDGYNLIGSEKGLRGNLEQRRKDLIEKLREYQDRKGCPITVVFDGWRSGWIYQTEERVGDLTVIFSRLGEKADAVIKRIAHELGSACVVITSDGELRRLVEACGATALSSRQFALKVRESDEPWDPGLGSDRPRLTPKKGNPRKLSKAERRRRAKLNRL
jgi:predicted RNA-binding protein with PIN domain